MRVRTVRDEGDIESAIQRELEQIEAQIGDLTAEFEEFEDWYAELRRQYGKPPEEAMEFLLDGDFAAFEQLVRDGYQPPVR